MSVLSPRDDSCPDSDSSSEVDEVEEAESFESRGNDSNRESRFWYFEGKLTMDWGRPGDYSMPDKDALAAHFGGNDCHKTAPFTVIHMHILANLAMAGLLREHIHRASSCIHTGKTNHERKMGILAAFERGPAHGPENQCDSTK